MSTAVPAKPGSYVVARPRNVCSVSQQPIAADEPFMAALRESAEGFERMDIKLEHWPSVDQSSLVAFWRTVVPKVEAKKKLLVDDSVLCDLLIRLADVTEPAKLSFRFVLALILMRKKLVIYEGSQTRDGTEVWTIRLRGRDGTFQLVDPKPTEEQIGQVSEQLGEILSENS